MLLHFRFSGFPSPSQDALEPGEAAAREIFAAPCPWGSLKELRVQAAEAAEALPAEAPRGQGPWVEVCAKASDACGESRTSCCRASARRT